MHKWAATFGILCIGLLPSTVKAVDIDSFLLFGDSYFDTGAGNRIALELGLPANDYPNPQPQYADGRHCNGPNWADFTSLALDTPKWNFAVSGAETGSGNNGNLAVFGGLFQQVDRYRAASHGHIKESQLVIMDGGGNDFLVLLTGSTPITPELLANTVTQAIDNLSEVFSELQGMGAEKIVMWNLGDFNKLPLFSDPNMAYIFPGSTPADQRANQMAAGDAFSATAVGFNEALNFLVSGSNGNTGSDQQIFIFDAFTAFNELESELTAEGINITQHTLYPTDEPYPYDLLPLFPPSFTPPDYTSQPDRLAFYDYVHPTSFAWQMFTKYIASYVNTLIDGPRFIAAEQDLAFEGNRAFRDTLFNHFRVLHAQDYFCGYENDTCCECGQIYMIGQGKWGQTTSRAGTLGFRYNTEIAGIGLDYFLEDGLAVGALFDYQRNSAHIHNGRGRIQYNDYIPTAYVSWSDPCFFLDASISMHVYDFFKIHRNIPFLDRRARGHLHGLGYEMNVNAGLPYTCGCFTALPLVGLTYESIHLNHYREKHAGSLNLSVERQRQDSLIGRIGGQLYLNMEDCCFLPFLELIYDHEFFDCHKAIKSHFVGSLDNAVDYNRPSFTDRDMLKIGIGVDAKITPCLFGTVTYEGETTFRNFNNIVRGEIDWSF